MELDADKMLLECLRDGIRSGVAEKLKGYNSPLDKLVTEALTAHAEAFRGLLADALGSCVNDPAFRDDIKTAVRTKLAGVLVQRFGGELEKQVNALKSDPATRARITIAIEDILKSKTA